MLAELAPAKTSMKLGGPGEYVYKAFINAPLGKAISSIAIGAAAVFITLGGLGYRYKKTEVTFPRGAKAYQVEFGPPKEDVQNDWPEAVRANTENDGHSTSSVTEIKSFALEIINEMSFRNEIIGTLESNAVAVAA
jgi:hypothetical protein